MTTDSTQFYDFADFRIDLSEKILSRNGVLVPLTPKVYDTLEIFVENPGRLIEKDELFQRLWQDRFVEESNLTSNIKMLRKALNDDAGRPQFIETVPRRGYRFIADVRELSSENGSIPHKDIQHSGIGRFYAIGFRGVFAASIIALVLVVISSGYLLTRNGSVAAAAPILSTAFVSEQISTDGTVRNALVTPDGKNVVYTSTQGGKQSVWLRQLDTSNNIEIIPPSNDSYYGLDVSPDGRFLYFVRRPSSGGSQDTYRVSMFGGIPTKILNNTEGWLSLSPDGSRIAFVRCTETDDVSCSLLIADAQDGNGEKTLASRTSPFRIGDIEFAPDGRSIAFAVGQSQNQANEFGLSEVDVESGKERELSPERFFNVRSLTWLSNQAGLLVTASRVPNKHFRIWEVSRSNGAALALTNDAESYGRLSLTKAADLLVSTQGQQDFQLSVLTGDRGFARHTLTDATQATFAGNGKIYFSSIMSGNEEIWSINSDGTGKRQLTNDAADDILPVVSDNHDFVFFASNRTGSSHIWRMNPDGSDQTQITHREGGLPAFVSPDGKWVYFRHGLDRTLWRVSAFGNDEQLVFGKKLHEFAISPDGAYIAFFASRGKHKALQISSLVDGKNVQTLTLNDQTPAFNKVVWMPGGRSVVYCLSPAGDNQILWYQSLDGTPPRKLGDLGIEQVNSLSVSPDGRSFAIVQGTWKHDAVLFKGLR